jgi:hypothetical protein
MWLALIFLDTKEFSLACRNAIFTPFPMEFQYFNAYADKYGTDTGYIISRLKGAQRRRP